MAAGPIDLCRSPVGVAPDLSIEHDDSGVRVVQSHGRAYHSFIQYPATWTAKIEGVELRMVAREERGGGVTEVVTYRLVFNPERQHLIGERVVGGQVEPFGFVPVAFTSCPPPPGPVCD